MMSSTPPDSPSNINSQSRKCPFIIMPISERQRKMAAAAASNSISATPINSSSRLPHVPGIEYRNPLQSAAVAHNNTGMHDKNKNDLANSLTTTNVNPNSNSSTSSSNLFAMHNTILHRKLREFYESRNIPQPQSGGLSSKTQVYRQPSCNNSPQQNQQTSSTSSNNIPKNTNVGLSKNPKAIRRPIQSIVETELHGDQNNHNNTSTSANTLSEVSKSKIIIETLQSSLKEAHLKLHEKDAEILNIRQELHTLRKSIQEAMNESKSSKALYEVLKYDLMNCEKQLEILQEKLRNYEIGQKEFVATNTNHHKSRSSSTSSSRTSSSSSGKNIAIEFRDVNNKTCSADKNKLMEQPSPLQIDYDKLVTNIRDLNALVGNSNQLELCYNSCGATFKHNTQSIELNLYKNGLKLDTDNKFRPYHSIETTAFIQDIYDGYFPSELQLKYPNGIILIVNDYRAVNFNSGGGPSTNSSCFSGKGIKLKSSSTNSSYSKDCSSIPSLREILPGINFNCSKIGSNNNTKNHHHKNIPVLKIDDSANSCLNAPTTTSSTSSVTTVLSASLSVEQLPDLTSVPIEEAKYSDKNSSVHRGQNQIITLKLRNLVSNGKQYKLRVNVNTSIDQITQHLTKHIGHDDTGNDDLLSESDWNDDDGDCYFHRYQLVNSLPFGIFGDGSASLKDYKIVSNCLLYFRKTFP